MTPKVRDILIDCRKQIHAAIAEQSVISDTHALHILDQLIVADASRCAATLQGEEVVAHLNPDDEDDDSEIRDLQRRLREAERQRDQDSKIIDGLRDKLNELKKKGGQ